MGNFYTNFTLRGPSQKDVVAALAGRTAFVSPEQNGCVVIFDEKSDSHKPKQSGKLAAQLSGKFACTVLAALNHDDDFLAYQLYSDGKLIDEYNSGSAFAAVENKPSGPKGGDAQKLCAAFGKKNVRKVEGVLHKSAMENDRYVFAVLRHFDLVSTLGASTSAAGTGYNDLIRGFWPEGLKEKDFVKVK